MHDNIFDSNKARLMWVGTVAALIFGVYPISVGANEKPAAQLLQEIANRAYVLQSGAAQSSDGTKPASTSGGSNNLSHPASGDNVKPGIPSYFTPADNSSRSGVAPDLLQNVKQVLERIQTSGTIPQSSSVINPNKPGVSEATRYEGPAPTSGEFKAATVSNNSNTTDLAVVRSLLEEVLKRLMQLTSQ